MPVIMQFSRQAAAPAPMTFDNSQNRQPAIIAASVISLVLAILSTIGRVAARRRVRAALQTDDFLIFAGLVMATGVVISTLIMEHFGLGRHIDLVTHPAQLAMSVVASQLLYALSIIPIKLSILALYHRLFPAAALVRACWAIASVVVAYSAAFTIGVGLQCIPLEKVWEPEIPGTCFDADILYIVTAVINVLTDLAILTLPLPYIWGLSLPKARKIQLIAVFLLGAVVIAFGIVRAVAVTTASTMDESWNDVSSAVWSEVEICIGVVSANLPCLRPLFFWLPTAMRGSTAKETPKYALKGGASGYGGSSKRRSNNPGAFEMSRRSRVVGGAWEETDGSSDVQPFAAAESVQDDSRSDKAPATNTARALSPSGMGGDGRTAGTPEAEGAARTATPEPGHRSIVVETTIETRFERSQRK